MKQCFLKCINHNNQQMHNAVGGDIVLWAIVPCWGRHCALRGEMLCTKWLEGRCCLMPENGKTAGGDIVLHYEMVMPWVERCCAVRHHTSGGETLTMKWQCRTVRFCTLTRLRRLAGGGHAGGAAMLLCERVCWRGGRDSAAGDVVLWDGRDAVETLCLATLLMFLFLCNFDSRHANNKILSTYHSLLMTT